MADPSARGRAITAITDGTAVSEHHAGTVVDALIARPDVLAALRDGVGTATPADPRDAEIARLRAELAEFHDFLRPRIDPDTPVEPDDPEGMRRRRDELIDRLIAERTGPGEPLHELLCPQCGATIRARMADAEPGALAPCGKCRWTQPFISITHGCPEHDDDDQEAW